LFSLNIDGYKIVGLLSKPPMDGAIEEPTHHDKTRYPKPSPKMMDYNNE